jgi:hypothetical protein
LIYVVGGISRDNWDRGIDSESGRSMWKKETPGIPQAFRVVSGLSPDLREIHFPIGIPVKASPRIIISRHGRRVLEGKCGVWGDMLTTVLRTNSRLLSH